MKFMCDAQNIQLLVCIDRPKAEEPIDIDRPLDDEKKHRPTV